MSEDPRIQEIVDLLLEKTRRREITWNSTLLDGSFMTSFPRHSVRISLDRPPDVLLSIYNDTGTIFSEISSGDESPHSSSLLSALNGSASCAKLTELYDVVRDLREDAEFTELLQELREAS